MQVSELIQRVQELNPSGEAQVIIVVSTEPDDGKPQEYEDFTVEGHPEAEYGPEVWLVA